MMLEMYQQSKAKEDQCQEKFVWEEVSNESEQKSKWFYVVTINPLKVEVYYDRVSH